MNGTRGQFLAGAALPEQQYGGVSGGDAPDQVGTTAQRRTDAHHIRQRRSSVEPVPQDEIFVAQRLHTLDFIQSQRQDAGNKSEELEVFL